MKKKDPIGIALGLAPPDEPEFELAKAEPLSFAQDDHVKDYEVARQQAHDLLAKGNQVLEMLMKATADEPTTGKFEVLATLIKTLGDANMQLLDVQQKFRSIAPEKARLALEEPGVAMKRGSITDLLREAKEAS